MTQLEAIEHRLAEQEIDELLQNSKGLDVLMKSKSTTAQQNSEGMSISTKESLGGLTTTKSKRPQRQSEAQKENGI
jgi:hypothetical protein